MIDKLSLKHWAKLLLKPDYRKYSKIDKELERLKKEPRYTPLSTMLLGEPLKLVDGKSFYYSYKEIFLDEIYKFLSRKSKPLIIDCGSNIGLSILYFKKNYPKSKIIAFEPDPIVYNTLQENLKNFNYNDVEAYNKAVWDKETTLNFIVEGADSGKVRSDDSYQTNIQVKVSSVCLSDYLSEPIDFLKLDIEGAETVVLKECANQLDNIDNLFIEYHSFWRQEQTIDEILSILKNADFRVSIQSQFAPKQPFIEQTLQLGMDLQLNIFAYRTHNDNESFTNQSV